MMIVYIAGPMSGIEDYNRPYFFKAEGELRAMGHKVLNPAVLPTDLPDEAYMPICLAMIDQCDAVCLLDGWEQSQGAVLEAVYAQRCGKDQIVWANF